MPIPGQTPSHLVPISNNTSQQSLEPIRQQLYRSECGSYKIPSAAPDEFLIEKTPMYGRSTLTRARQMYIMKPNVKLFYMIIDPIERIVSHVKMHDRVFEHRYPNRSHTSVQATD